MPVIFIRNIVLGVSFGAIFGYVLSIIPITIMRVWRKRKLKKASQ